MTVTESPGTGSDEFDAVELEIAEGDYLLAVDGEIAAGKLVVTDTEGGVMSGILSTGSNGIDMTPTSTMTMEITDAKMGR